VPQPSAILRFLTWIESLLALHPGLHNSAGPFEKDYQAGGGEGDVGG
jgi:hypothetical protein